MTESLEQIIKKVDVNEMIKSYKDRLSSEQEINIMLSIQLKKLTDYTKEIEEELQDYKNLVESQTADNV